MPTIRFEQEGQQVGCIEGANLRKAALDAGVNPYNGLNNLNNCGGVGQCGTCVMESLKVRPICPRAAMWKRCPRRSSVQLPPELQNHCQR